jgi:hypothetical protein
MSANPEAEKWKAAYETMLEAFNEERQANRRLNARWQCVTGQAVYEALRIAGEGGDPYMHRAIRDYQPSTGYEGVTLDAMFDLEEAARLLRELKP